MMHTFGSQVGPLLALAPPTLFVKGEADESCSTGLLAQLLLSGHVPCKDARLLVVPVSSQGHHDLLTSLRLRVPERPTPEANPSDCCSCPPLR